jgi:hypothetical protein
VIPYGSSIANASQGNLCAAMRCASFWNEALESRGARRRSSAEGR